MVEASLRASRRPDRGGLDNALFVVAAAEQPPIELCARANLVTVTLPWGSLLRGVLALDDAAAAGIAGLVAPSGAVEALISVTERDRGALGVAPLAADDRDELAERWTGHGMTIRRFEPASGADLARSGSTWARRLMAPGHRRVTQDRPVWRLVLEPIGGHAAGRTPDRGSGRRAIPYPAMLSRPAVTRRLRSGCGRATLVAMTAALAASLAAPGAVAAGSTSSTAETTDASAAATPYRVNLADANDFVAQTNFVQCVGASMQMMLNIAGDADRSARTQLRLQELARGLSGPTRAGFERKGASVRGWSAGLNELGAGPYRLVGATTIDEAMQLAARSIRETGKPIGLLMWAGRHAWVMSGFEATADPGTTDDFRVTRAIVLDPLYPYGSSRWGASPRPGQALAVPTLGKQFVPRRQGTWPGALTIGDGANEMASLAGKYVLVLPYLPVVVARSRPVPV